ncbi:MAG TPA: alpha/beta fold hydrolase [Myxococcota bacterium]|nr:alpha/beta fold hydrolase [Myxococcota bacterium]
MSLPGTRIAVNGIQLHVADLGPRGGKPVYLLHGFPDSSYLWRHQVPKLVDAGYRVIVPDLRGFGLSDKPASVDAYAMPTLIGDALGVLDVLQVPRAHVVCHDWGAALGWALAIFLPDRVERLVALSVGHLAGFGAAGMEQREKSWYMLYFQYEGIAEEALRADDWKLFRDWTRNHAELPHWIEDLSRPGALTAALSWYRANVNPARPNVLAMDYPPVKAPTLGIWSSHDAYLTEAQMTASKAFVEGPWRYERLEGASHWLQLDQPERVSSLILDWLGESGR